jgi:hypothetical protein
MMKCRLSDMPELRLGLNDKIEDVTFHQCVNLGTYEAQKVVTFIPPDGDFELMRCGTGAAGKTWAEGRGMHQGLDPALHNWHAAPLLSCS